MRVPFVDLQAQYLSLKPEIDAAIGRTIANSSFVRGPDVEAFEAEYAELMGAAHCVSCANGTDALFVAMKALGISPGDEVITTAQSWISTSETIGQHGAKPVFVDIDPITSTIDPSKIEEKITNRTVGIIPVHLYGQMADMDPIMDIARRRNLWVIEDCAQAHLATYKGRRAGSFGTIATWSFYPGKNLGAMGDAGAITTGDAALARHMACYARHGGLVKGEHEMEGINSRMDGIQAAILRVKLPHLEGWTAHRRAAAARYDALLAPIGGVVRPTQIEGRKHVYHLYVIETDERDALAKSLAAAGVPTVTNYRRALPFLPAYAHLGHGPADFPIAYRLQERILSLPLFAEITEEQQRFVADSIAVAMSQPRMSRRKRIYAIAILGRYGLTHGILAWARCRVWCEQHGATMVAPFWLKLRIGPYLRREFDKRNYFLLFHPGRGVAGLKRLALVLGAKRIDVRTEWPEIDIAGNGPTLIRFHNENTNNEQSFYQIAEHGDFLRRELIAITRPRYLPAEVETPFIALHVRMGDFILPQSATITNAVNTRLPVEWYADRLDALRAALGMPLRAVVFSDGDDASLAPLLEREAVSRAPRQQSVTDLLQIGQGVALIASRSGFSLWGAFLGNTPRISYPGQKIVPIHAHPERDIESAIGTDIPSSFVDQIRPRIGGGA